MHSITASEKRENEEWREWESLERGRGREKGVNYTII